MSPLRRFRLHVRVIDRQFDHRVFPLPNVALRKCVTEGRVHHTRVRVLGIGAARRVGGSTMGFESNTNIG